MSANLYEVLGVKNDATPEEVRKAYRRRALQTHPDRLPQNISASDKQAAEEQFRLVNNAYEVLNNSENRKLYDKHGVWPPPTEQPDYERRSSRDPFNFPQSPFANDPFFSAHFGNRFGPGQARPFAFTDPFELFNTLFGDTHSAFNNDPFFAGTPFTHSPFDDPFFRNALASPFGRTGDPFGRSMFGGQSPFGAGPPFGGGSPFAGFIGGPSFPAFPSMDMSGSSSRVYSSTTQAMGHNGQWQSRSQMTRTVNGRTESITKRVDADGNEHVTYSSPDGERYTINGVEQPRGNIEGPRHSGTAPPPHRSPPPAIAAAPANPPVSNYAPPPPAAQAYNVPVAGPSYSPHHTQPQPVVPPPPQDVYPERRSSRRSHRDRTSADVPRRSYTMPPHEQDPTPMPGGYWDRDRDHERRDSKLSRHDSRDYRDKDRDAGTSHSAQQRGWRGW